MLLPSLQYGARILRTADTRHLAKFMWNFGVKGVRSVNLFKKRMKEGVYFPPFLYLSILNSCNLRCQGCWVDVDKPQVKLELDELNAIVNDAKAHAIPSSESSVENPSFTRISSISSRNTRIASSRSSPTAR